MNAAENQALIDKQADEQANQQRKSDELKAVDHILDAIRVMPINSLQPYVVGQIIKTLATRILMQEHWLADSAEGSPQETAWQALEDLSAEFYAVQCMMEEE